MGFVLILKHLRTVARCIESLKSRPSDSFLTKKEKILKDAIVSCLTLEATSHDVTACDLVWILERALDKCDEVDNE